MASCCEGSLMAVTRAKLALDRSGVAWIDTYAAVVA